MSAASMKILFCTIICVSLYAQYGTALKCRQCRYPDKLIDHKTFQQWKFNDSTVPASLSCQLDPDEVLEKDCGSNTACVTYIGLLSTMKPGKDPTRAFEYVRGCLNDIANYAADAGAFPMAPNRFCQSGIYLIPCNSTKVAADASIEEHGKNENETVKSIFQQLVVCNDTDNCNSGDIEKTCNEAKPQVNCNYCQGPYSECKLNKRYCRSSWCTATVFREDGQTMINRGCYGAVNFRQTASLTLADNITTCIYRKEPQALLDLFAKPDDPPTTVPPPLETTLPDTPAVNAQTTVVTPHTPAQRDSATRPSTPEQHNDGETTVTHAPQTSQTTDGSHVEPTTKSGHMFQNSPIITGFVFLLVVLLNR